MRKFRFITVFALLPLFLMAGKIDRGFKALEIYNYFKAKELFYKSLKRDKLAASFGLSIIYGRKDNPFYNLDSAYKYINIADTLFPTLEQKDKHNLLKLNLDSNQIVFWKDTIDLKVFRKTQKLNSIDAFQAYIIRHSDSKLLEKAIFKRDSIAFYTAKSLNHSSEYKLFLENYPNSKFNIEAKNRFEERLFIEATLINTEKNYQRFLVEHSNSPYYSQIEDSIFAKHTSSNKISSYNSFIKTYPNNKNVNKAWKLIYKLYIADYSPERIVEFQIDYPNYPFLEDLESDLKLATKTLYPVQVNNKWGFIDRDGNHMIPFKYDFADDFHEGLALVMQQDKLGYITKSGETAIPIIYDEAESFVNGMAIVSKQDKYGIINRTNATQVEFLYEEIGSLESNPILVADEKAYGYINEKGEQIVPLKYKTAYDFKNGLAIVKDSSGYGMINSLGQLLIETKYTWLEPFYKYGICKAKNDSAYGLLDMNGGIILPFKYDNIGALKDSMILIAKNGKYGYASSNGEIALPLEFDYKPSALIFGQFKNGFAKYFLKEKYGVIDINGKVVPAIFEDIEEYSDSDLFAIKKRGKWGYSNENLRLIVPYKYQYAITFQNGIGLVQENNNWYFINEEGKILNEAGYNSIQRIKKNVYLIELENKVGVLDNSQNEIIPLIYDKIEEYGNNLLRLLDGNNVYYFDLELNKFIKPK